MLYSIVGSPSLAMILSHIGIGSVGGFLYVMRQHLKGYVVKPFEYIARPIFGGVAAAAFNAALGYPEHNLAFCLFVGYSGVDIWDALASRFQTVLPLSSKHEKIEVAPSVLPVQDKENEQPK